MEESEREAVFNHFNLNPQGFINVVLNSVKDMVNGAFDYYHKEEANIVGSNGTGRAAELEMGVVILKCATCVGSEIGFVGEVLHSIRMCLTISRCPNRCSYKVIIFAMVIVRIFLHNKNLFHNRRFPLSALSLISSSLHSAKPRSPRLAQISELEMHPTRICHAMNSNNRLRPEMQAQTPEQVYNIIPIHNLLADHSSLRFLEVQAAAAALKIVEDLRRLPIIQWDQDNDLLDWLVAFFGFQKDNVRNQREHLVLHLANAQMRMQPPPDNIDVLDSAVLQKFRKRLMKNYSSWCSYLGVESNIWISDRCHDPRRELLYVSLYLLVWGESANLRCIPECICYSFHQMVMELNKILEDIDENIGTGPARCLWRPCARYQMWLLRCS